MLTYSGFIIVIFRSIKYFLVIYFNLQCGKSKDIAI